MLNRARRPPMLRLASVCDKLVPSPVAQINLCVATEGKATRRIRAPKVVVCRNGPMATKQSMVATSRMQSLLPQWWIPPVTWSACVKQVRTRHHGVDFSKRVVLGGNTSEWWLHSVLSYGVLSNCSRWTVARGSQFKFKLKLSSAKFRSTKCPLFCLRLSPILAFAYWRALWSLTRQPQPKTVSASCGRTVSTTPLNVNLSRVM